MELIGQSHIDATSLDKDEWRRHAKDIRPDWSDEDFEREFAEYFQRKDAAMAEKRKIII